MKLGKIKGMAFIIVSSLLISTAMATSNPVPNRNEKPVQTAPSTMPSQKPVQTAPSTMPSQKPAQPAPSMTPSQKPAQPAPSMMPSQKPAQPAPSTMPSQKPSTSVQPGNCKPPMAPVKGGVENKSCPSKGQGQHKPFMLDNFKVIANTLKACGVDDAKLTNYISQGKKLEDVLKEENISVRKFKKQVVKEYNRVVDEAEKNGQLTSDQCKQLKSAIKQTIKGWLPKK